MPSGYARDIAPPAQVASPCLTVVEGEPASAPAIDGASNSQAARHHCSNSCNVKYHASRAVEEADKASQMHHAAGRLAHEGLAYLHLRAASELRRRPVTHPQRQDK